MRIFGCHTSRPATEHQKEVRKTDIAVSKVIRYLLIALGIIFPKCGE
jgi:hypothetical protein